MRKSRFCILMLVMLCGLAVTPVSLYADTEKAIVERLDTPYRDWWREVALLITKDERQQFLALAKDYQRDLFIRRFWEARNPDPGSNHNVFKEQWERRIEAALDFYGNITEDRAVALMIHSAPQDLRKTDCGQFLWPLEIWHFTVGERLSDDFYVLFYQTSAVGNFKIWRTSDSLAALVARLTNEIPRTLPRAGGPMAGSAPQAPDSTDFTGLSQTSNDLLAFARFLNINCPNDEEMLLNALTQVELEDSYHQLDNLLVPPAARDAEWLASFRSGSTDLPKAAVALKATLDIKFPARDRSRTVVSGIVSVPAADAQPVDLEGHRAYNFMMTGEVLKGWELAETFRYRFDLPAGAAPPRPASGKVAAAVEAPPLPLAFERSLAPGDYLLVLRVEDLHSHHHFRVEQPITVPPVDGLPDVRAAARAPEVTAILDAARAELGNAAAGDAAAAATAGASPAGAGAPGGAPGSQSGGAAAAAARAGSGTGAAAGAGAGDVAVRLVPPEGDKQTGAVRLEAKTAGGGIRKVTFFLDGKEMLSRVRAPYSIELTLGEVPVTHEVRATAYGPTGAELASDALVLNPPQQRFAVRLVEPRAGGAYKGQVLARADIHLPDGGKLDRLELFLDDNRVATLYQPPWAQMVALPPNAAGPSYVRAVGYLADGTSSEGLSVINSRDVVEALDVRVVELYASVVDRTGRPVERLQQGDFKVMDGGVPQTLVRFEQVRDRPLQLMFMLDTSASMAVSLPQVQSAALAFLTRVLTPKDRAALLTFSDNPVLRTPFTNDITTLASALAGLNAERGTALFDSLVYALSYMKGAENTQSALVLFTDGGDHVSHLRFEEALAFARRSGIALYTIGAQISRLDLQARAHLAKLAEETGGRSFFIDSAADLRDVYASIENELRSRYLLAYQPTAAPHQGEYRSVDVHVTGDGLKVKALRGYYP